MRPDEQAAWQREQQRQRESAYAAQQARQRQAEYEARQAAAARAEERRQQELYQQQQRAEKAARQRAEETERDKTAKRRRQREQEIWQQQHQQHISEISSSRTPQPVFDTRERARSGSFSGKLLAGVFVIGLIAWLGHSNGSPSDHSQAKEGQTQTTSSSGSASLKPNASVDQSVVLSTDTQTNEAQSPTPLAPPTAPAASPENTAGQLNPIYKVAPSYPELAASMDVHGQVLVAVRVTPDGFVQSAGARNGDPRLINAAVDAARQWRYAPYTPVAGQSAVEQLILFTF